jgi:uncharacterized membrane protein
MLQVLTIALTVSHAVSAAMWVGAVFMASLIDWPVIRSQTPRGQFPFGFLVAQGQRIFPWIYLAIVLLWVSGVGLVILHGPLDTAGWVLLALKVVSLAFMTGSTVYGTLSSWPKIQFATDEEAFELYRVYLIRAYITFACGLVGVVAGTVLGRLSDWFITV